MTETVLVTGGTGFIGSYVVEELSTSGHNVVAYDISTDNYTLEKLGIAEDVTVRRGDISEPTDVIRAVRETGATRIVHLAAILTTTARDNPRRALDVNVQGTNNVLEAARLFDDQVERVAWASSGAVYAPPQNYDAEFVDEDELVHPATLYGATKEYNEHQARTYHRKHGVSPVGLRPTVAYGPHRDANVAGFLANIFEKPARGEPFSVKYGDQLLDWQHARDIAQAFRKATFADDAELSRRVYNIRGEMATVDDVARILRDIIPDVDLEVSDEGELPWTHNLDMTAAQEDLGYEVEYDLETGCRKYVDTLREEAGLEPV